MERLVLVTPFHTDEYDRLDEKGVNQMRTVASQLNGFKPDIIYTPPYGDFVVSAERLAQRTITPYEVTRGLDGQRGLRRILNTHRGRTIAAVVGFGDFKTLVYDLAQVPQGDRSDFFPSEGSIAIFEHRKWRSWVNGKFTSVLVSPPLDVPNINEVVAA